LRLLWRVQVSSKMNLRADRESDYHRSLKIDVNDSLKTSVLTRFFKKVILSLSALEIALAVYPHPCVNDW